MSEDAIVFKSQTISTSVLLLIPRQGFDVDIPKTSVEAALALLASLCDQLPELKAVSDFINTLTSACRKSTAASFLISQICMSGQISVNASKQPIRAKAEKIYLHVGEQKQSLQEVAEAPCD